MQHFQPILIVIGILAIAAVLIHGYILSRKEKIPVTDNLSDRDDLLSAKTDANCQEGIVGDVRIIRTYREEEDESCDFSLPFETDEVEDINFDTDLSHKELSENVERQSSEDDFSKPLIAAHQKLGCEEITEPVALDNEPPLRDEIEAFICHGDAEQEAALEIEQAVVKNAEPEQQQSAQEAQDIFIFNVVAKEGSYVRGHELLQFFLTAGFRFGEMSIFHRHLHSDGTGPVLFSIANMMAPGVFDPEKMEQFRSEGVSFFLTAPNNDINIKEAFDMMLVAVEQMAEEFDCVVLNAEREPLTEKQFRNYHERLLHYI